MNFTEQDAMQLIGAQQVRIFVLERELAALRAESAQAKQQKDKVVPIKEAADGTG